MDVLTKSNIQHPKTNPTTTMKLSPAALTLALIAVPAMASYVSDDFPNDRELRTNKNHPNKKNKNHPNKKNKNHHRNKNKNKNHPHKNRNHHASQDTLSSEAPTFAGDNVQALWSNYTSTEAPTVSGPSSMLSSTEAPTSSLCTTTRLYYKHHQLKETPIRGENKKVEGMKMYAPLYETSTNEEVGVYNSVLTYTANFVSACIANTIIALNWDDNNDYFTDEAISSGVCAKGHETGGNGVIGGTGKFQATYGTVNYEGTTDTTGVVLETCEYQ